VKHKFSLASRSFKIILSVLLVSQACAQVKLVAIKTCMMAQKTGFHLMKYLMWHLIDDFFYLGVKTPTKSL
jgi:hypothetical protein